jgi:GT2 family glycosyltransferase
LEAGAPAEILVLDQTAQHESATEERIRALHVACHVRWLRFSTPSIPQALNRGLLEASEDIVLFVDDDVRPEPELVAAHHAAQAAQGAALVAGRVIQPWQEGQDLSKESDAPFASIEPRWVDEFIGANFSVRRDLALTLGGFDENFVRVAYRFEAEFAHRWRASGRRIWFEPAACLHHLKDGAGGTRSFGEHLTTWRPNHAVGAYYYALRTKSAGEFLRRPFRAVGTRYHLRHPWRIPVTLLAEVSGMAWAASLSLRGPKYAVAPQSASNV